MSNLKKLAFRGMIWTVAGYGGSQVLRLGGNLLLTRLLIPELFGLMALVNIFIIGLALFSDVGLGISIVQSKRGDESSFANTAWTIQVVRGFGLWLACLVLAYPVALFYEEPRLFWLIPIVGLTTIIGGFNSTALFAAQRHLAIHKITVMELATQAIHVIVMLVWALLQPTIWALVAGSIVAAIVKLIWSHFLIKGYSNRFVWDKSAVKEIISIGRWVLLATAVSFIAEQVDRLLLAKLFTLELVGIYSIALMLSDVPRQVTISLSGRVIFPTVSKLIDLPRPELRSKVLRSRRLLLLALTAGMLLLISFGDQLILFMYDDRYTDAAWMLPILALGIWPRLLCSTIETSLTALGKVQYSAFGNLSRLVFTGAGIFIGSAWMGIVGAVIAVALNDLFYYIVINYGLCRHGMNCLMQDAKVTLLLLAGLFIGAFSRLVLGLEMIPFAM